jgi:hypothetical protein
MIKAMSSDEKVGVVLFYASQPVISSVPANPAEPVRNFVCKA